MPGDVNYAHEKYAAARDTLAEGSATLRERLMDAYASQATRAVPLQHGLGPEISDELSLQIDAFDRLMTAEAALGSEGTIAATVNSMDDEDVRSAVSELLAIASALDREYYGNSQ